ncbi:gamma-glutamyl hydrolase [Monoraphidium neglectum]|uniref:folate gamma-glutamyl hydrolase n=1 Tax=Monoraphidium neglectum TaxID=145388 RepID=A0A0D2LIN0_9CHLO|nr:gamma-glutamyl hydrolase [Monoraphidium neglectum]KIZ06309.1 gamma-glutamyl hydrolase [Monoraphidium neglectum]|eukprot:XP_013905328.1 gamma-glutamyl hydrolase [Monoraphidium neglectum]
MRSSTAASGYKNTEPIIGILTQPCTECPGRSYIGASYVKWVEAAGGRVAPIRFYASDAELHRLFKSVNGLVFAGGLTWLWLDSPYVIAARKLFNWAVQANEAGNPFPIHGTCLGHQLLHILAANVSRNDLLVETDAVTQPSTLIFTAAANTSRTLKDLPSDLVAKLQDDKLNIAMQNHEYGIPPHHYQRWPLLGEWFNVLTTSKDRKGLEYISTVEAKKYPFTGTQWHPEKPTSEFGMIEVPHTLDAVRVGQHFANRFVDTARYSSHKPSSPEQELAVLIYSTPPVFSARFETMAEDNYDGPYVTYYFDQKTKPPVGPEDDEHEGGGGTPDLASRATASRSRMAASRRAAAAHQTVLA